MSEELIDEAAAEAETTPADTKRMTEADWEEASVLYEQGTITLDDLAKRFSVSKGALSKGFKKRGVERGSKSKIIRKEIEEAVAKEAAERAERAAELLRTRSEETKEFHYKADDTLSKLTLSVLIKAQKEGRALATCKGDLLALRIAAQTLTKIREDRYTLLGLDQNADAGDELRDLEVRELSQDDIDQLNERQRQLAEEDEFEALDLDDALAEADALIAGEDDV